MSWISHRVTKPPAQAPGTVEFRGARKTDEVSIKLIEYSGDHFEERIIEDYRECLGERDPGMVTWINVNGLHDTEMLKEIGSHFGLHPLVLEDIVNTHQRPKVDEFTGYIYIVSRMLSFDADKLALTSEQISFVLADGLLLTFQERPGDVLEPVRERLRHGKGKIRINGAGYLAYALLDAVVDQYFSVLEALGDKIEFLEESMLVNPDLEDMQRTHFLKRELVLLRRAAWPMREVVSALMRGEYEFFGSHVSPFLRDLYDHVIQVAEAVDLYRDILSGLQDLSMSSMSNRMNDVMKVLTIFASIFVPLTFVAGVYGMNFEHMPELSWRWSYPVFWAAIVVLISVMLMFFRRRRWL